MNLRENILKCSYELFCEKGFEKTTVSEIINKVGCSKGGFYHHFKSKEEIMEVITLNYLKKIEEWYERIVNKQEQTVLLINELIKSINLYKEEQIKEWPKIAKLYAYKNSDIVLKKMADRFEDITAQYYTKLFEKGNREGVFFVKYPEFLGKLWIREVLDIYKLASEVILQADENSSIKFEEKLNFTEQLFNNTLGLENELVIKEPVLAYIVKAREEINNT